MAYLEELFGLGGRVAMVTGASSGLGAEAAEALAGAGADVALVARRADRLEALGRELEKHGVRSATLALDLAAEGAAEEALERAERALGPVSIVLNGAGVAPLGRAERHGRDRWDLALALNLTAPFQVSQAAARRMIQRGEGGCIIMLSSVMGSLGNPVHRAVGYAASKGGLENLTRHLAVEWAPHGIRVNAIAPAYFPTEMTVDPRRGEVAPEQAEVMRRFTPLGRLGRDGELRSAVLFLAAPASSYVTGSVVTVDGGWTAW